MLKKYLVDISTKSNFAANTQKWKSYMTHTIPG